MNPTATPRHRLVRLPNATALAVLLALGTPIASLPAAAEESPEPSEADTAIDTMPTEPEARSPSSESVQPQIEERASDETERERDTIVAEAVEAIERTEAALAALEEDDPEKAIAALEAATGKLEIVLARDPSLALVPVDVTTRTHDLIAEVATVERLVEETEEALEEGRVQLARQLLDALASEIIVRTTNLPLATYPDAIKAIAPLIDAGNLELARSELLLALDTLVVIEEVLPLPWLRAEALLVEAEGLAENEARSDEQSVTLEAHLAAARHELELAEALGYGTAGIYAPMFEQIEAIEEKSGGGRGGAGWFTRVREQVAELFD